MIVQIHSSTLKGTIYAPSSKSSMQRACAAALIKKGISNIFNPGVSNDDLAALDVIKKLGAVIKDNADGSITITSNGIVPESEEINCGESGLGIRMFTPIAALSNQPITINGTGSLVTRPMNFFDEIFPLLSIEIHSSQGKLPLKIKGPLKPSNIKVDGSLSSQFLTGLLMAFSTVVAEPVTIEVDDLKSRPYIDLTLKVMEAFGLNVPKNDNYESFSFSPVNADQTTVNYTVEGDWSGAAFLLVAGAVAGKITVKGLDASSTQADKAVLQALINTGCVLSIKDEEIEVGPAPLKAFHFNATDCPDLFPPLVALASFCEGTTVIEGVSRLAHKESNRALTLQEEFGKLGVEIILQGDLMMIKPGALIGGATVQSHHDHRIAMACAVAALRIDGGVVIENANAINKSYPDFYKHLEKLGASVVC
jgi:3-phosphoshikimate 1-carboxyvinyltransferase